MGARQVGKTYALKEFARVAYENMLYLNLEKTPALHRLFSENLDPHRLIKILSIEKEIEIYPDKTLIIFDEIQECPSALNCLKYFCEEANEYHICAAGSLLGITLAHTKGFPVGKVNFLSLYPLSFAEYLDALEQSKLKDFFENIEKIEPLPAILHEKLLKHFKDYLFVGGMPEAIAEYIKSENFLTTREIQLNILTAYQLDFSKHVPKEQLMRTHQIWESIPAQLAKENKKFIYSIIRQGARAKDFEMALQWLVEAGLLHKVCYISAPKLPLSAYREFNFFKLYLVDVGLLGAMSQLSPAVVIHGNELFQEFRGALVENYIAQVLFSDNVMPYYWASENRAELDFVIQNEQEVYPIEIKSGTSNRKKSLLIYMEKYQPTLGIRLSPMNLMCNGNILNIPLYLTSQLRRLLELQSRIRKP
jgi:predicted AAA+ superfamily ATPase